MDTINWQAIVNQLGHAFLDLWLDAAIWLVVGLVVAGLLRTFVRSDGLGRQLQGDGIWPVLKAAIIGIPLPLCSCGVIPAAIGLRRAGASKGATTAFLISTPETGVDSIAISYALLGPFMAVIRPIAALSSAIVAAVLVMLGEKKRHSNQWTFSSVQAKPNVTKSGADAGKAPSSCCCQSGCQTSPESEPSLMQRMWQGQRYAFTDLLSDLSCWLLVGLFFSALVVTFVPYDALAEISRGAWAMVIMALVGVPMYICASASTPLAAALMLAGVSPGAVLVFLLAGPATNVATLGIVKKEMGWRTLCGYLVGVIGVAIGFGYLTNFLVAHWQIDMVSQLNESTEMMPMWLSASAALFLAILVFKDLLRR
jgi:uncharacterized membrane protein YraQ (UPF0718 family)